MSTAASVAERPSATEPADVVRAFLEAFEADQLDEAFGFLAEDVVWTNVSLPTIRGRARIERLLRPGLEKLGGGFRVQPRGRCPVEVQNRRPARITPLAPSKEPPVAQGCGPLTVAHLEPPLGIVTSAA
jgi:hypothetical protein